MRFLKVLPTLLLVALLGCGAGLAPVLSTLSITGLALPVAQAGQNYAGKAQASGGTPTYVWAVKSGSLPAGLSINPQSGEIWGTPMQPGTADFTLSVSDTSKPVQSKDVATSIVVVPIPLVITSLSLPAGQVGQAYAGSLQASGGTSTFTWSIVSGSLPAGLTLTPATGAISGIPLVSGTFNLKLAVADSGSPAQTQQISTSITVAPAPLAISSLKLLSAQVGVAYSTTVQANGGVAPYQWSITSGTLPSGLALDAATGIIAGTPTAVGNSTIAVTVVDAGTPAQTQTVSVSVPVLPSQLKITTTALSTGIAGQLYLGTLLANGGTAPYKWSLAFGALPVGLALDPNTGIITGIAAAAGSNDLVVSVTDSSTPTQSATTTLPLNIKPLLSVSSAALPDGTSGQSYSASLSASGGTPGYTWSLASGSLPAGLSLNSATGEIAGTPSAAGTAAFSVTATDSGTPAQSKTVSKSITITPPVLSITSTTLPSGTSGQSYSATLQASGGTSPYTWSLQSGSLPAGLSLNAGTGVISGTPTGSGSSSFTIAVADSGAPAQTKTASTSITIAPPALSITSATLPSGSSGQSYSATLQASGGTAPYTWSIQTGSLPAGLSLNASTGVISGSPTGSGSSSFTIAVTDSGTPAQTQTASTSITISAPSLTITSSNLPNGTVGQSYSTALQASGGSGNYTWTLPSGSMPQGLTLTSTGLISGSPTASGTSTFTAAVLDNQSQAQATSSLSITVAAAAPSAPGTTWYIRTDGGTRYSANASSGQCDGKSDAAYPGTGVNQHCAFNDVRYMWMDSTVGNFGWVMAGGDTLVIRGCAAQPDEQNPDAPHCRIGWNKSDHKGTWCQYVSDENCAIPPPPSGTSSQHTRILGACAYGSYSCNPVSGYPYTNNNLTQLYGGFNVPATLFLSGASYIDIEGIEITSHNGQCTRHGYPHWPGGCSTSDPYSDFADIGIFTTNTTGNILMQDVYIHGFSNGIFGPIGGPFTLTRVSIDFNTFAGWNFDTSTHDENGPGSSITQSYVSMYGNGCLEEYPIVHPQFPAKACWDSSSGGFGDAWSGQALPSGQPSHMDSFTCDHCDISYNTKDGALGPHTLLKTLTLSNSRWVGNMGQQHKWASGPSSTSKVINNLIVGNCARMTEQVPGAAQNFNIGTGLDGSYLSNYCRAAGNTANYSVDSGSTFIVANNTVVSDGPTVFDLDCSVDVNPHGCGSSPYQFIDNIFLGYISSSVPGYNGQAPGLYYKNVSDVVIQGSNNLEFGIRNGDSCGANGNICADPRLVNQPAQGSLPPESILDNLDIHITLGSPAIGAGIDYPGGLPNDYFGKPQTSPKTIGAAVP